MIAKFVLFLCIFLAKFDNIVYGDSACNTPSALWCDDEKITQQCGAGVECANSNATVFDKKIKITFIYETLCPHCQNFIITELYPQIFLNGSDFVELDLIPYGNAHIIGSPNGTYEFKCQHGPVECAGNKLHSCVIHYLKDPNRYFPFVYCMESALHAKQDPTLSAEVCLNRTNIAPSEQELINQCYNGELGVQLQVEAAIRTSAIQPEKHDHVPWILVNDVSTSTLQMYQGDLFHVLCAWYKGTTKPANCQYIRW